MNIRRRLRISNVLMIAVPAVIALLVGMAIIVAVWALVMHGTGLGRDDAEDFSQTARAVAQVAADTFGDIGSDSEAPGQTAPLDDVLDANDLSIVAIDGSTGAELYRHGAVDETDRELMRAGLELTGDAELARDGRSLSIRRMSVGERGLPLIVCVMGDTVAGSEAAAHAVIAAAVVALAFALVVVVTLTNRFLTSFVLRHVTDPLDELVDGVRQIRDGNLAYRLPVGRDDEFAPVFDDFNEMACRLEDSVARDRRAEEERRTLIVGLSHDLRSPLTSIQAYAEGLIDGIAKTPAARRRYLATIVSKSEELQGLVRRISLVSRMDGELVRTELAPMRLDRAVAAWVEANREAYGLRGVDIDVELACAEARADGELLDRMLGNLLDNCAKYARGGRERCRVEVSVRRTDGAGALLRVSDDGPGASEEDRAQLFDLFFRGDPARTESAEGNGIGLAVVARAMERMGGCARALEAAGGGLAVELEFPPAGP